MFDSAVNKKNIEIPINIEETLNRIVDKGNVKITTNIAKELRLKDLLEIIFRNSYKSINNCKNKFESFLYDFSNSEKFELLYLDTKGKEFRTTHNDKKNKTLKNFVLVCWNDNEINEWGNNNGAAIFFDLEYRMNKSYNNNETIKFLISRIEFLNIEYLKGANLLNKVDFKIVNFKEETNVSVIVNPNNIIGILRDVSKIENLFSDDSKNSLKFEMWKDLIDVMNQDTKESNKERLLYIYALEEINNDLIDDNNYIKNVILFSKSNKHNFDVELNLVDPKDEMNKFKISIVNKKNFDLKEYFNKIVNEIEIELEKNKNDIKANNDILKKDSDTISKLENNEVKLKEELLFLEEEKEKINKLIYEYEENKENNKKKNEKISLKEKELKTNFDVDEIKFELQKINDERSNLSKEIEYFNNAIIESNKNKLKIDQQIFSKKEEIYEVEENKNKINTKINDLHKKINYTKEKNNVLEHRFKIYNKLINEMNTNCINNVWICDLKFKLDENQTNINLYIVPVFSFDKFYDNFWCISEDDIGLITKFKRYKHAFNNAISGYYRNPYMIHSLIKTSEINKLKDVPEYLKNKYKLNDLQIDAVKKAISTRDLFYLQGPPGTGKTQTICAITEEIVSNNKNVLMTSSTHEAINNYFDRLNKENKNNPNIIIWKYMHTNKSNNNHSTSEMYSRFIKRIKTFIEETTNNNLELELIYKKLKSIVIDNKIEDCFLYTETHFSILRDNYKNKKLSDQENFIFNKLREKNEFFDEIFDEIMKEPKYIFYQCLEEYRKFCKLVSLKGNNNIECELNEIFIKLNENNINIFKKNFNDLLNDLNDLIQKNNSNKNNLLKNHINNYFKNNNIDDLKNNDFLKFVFENNYINVIGITTTSRTTIEMNGNEKDLFSEYPIETVIIDEISKSSTPEILARIILAKKAICCGDYNQLPPVSDLNSDATIKKYFDPIQLGEGFIEKHLTNYLEEDTKKKIFDILKKNNMSSPDNVFQSIDEGKYIGKIKKWIDKLYQESFFTNQVKKVKEKGNKNNANNTYQYLKTQFRFNEEIMSVVNLFYDKTELLEMPKENTNNSKTTKIYVDVNGIIKHDNVLLLDTTFLSKEFSNIQIYSNIAKKANGNYSFDQKELIDKNLSKIRSKGRINEHNGFVIINILKSIVKSSKELEIDIENKIGIICLTINQKHVIKGMIKKYNSDLLNLNIKIDTIDNFQGREKDIIIVDFVCSRDVYNEGKINKLESRNLDFISSKQRINVAFSRAKSKLIIVGAFDYYLKIEKNDQIKNITEQLINIKEKISFI